MNVPQPFQYQESKRNLAPRILDYLPRKMRRLVEPFAGSGALSLACAGRGRGARYWLNDLNRPLSELLSLMVNRPEEVADCYREVWRDRDADHLEHFHAVRDAFNRTHDPKLLLYLLARCVKGAVRYNGNSDFNQSPDKRRLGTHPAKMRANIMGCPSFCEGSRNSLRWIFRRSSRPFVRTTWCTWTRPIRECAEHATIAMRPASHSTISLRRWAV